MVESEVTTATFIIVAAMNTVFEPTPLICRNLRMKFIGFLLCSQFQILRKIQTINIYSNRFHLFAAKVNNSFLLL